MTIIVNVTVPEGIVFAADSRQTYTNKRGDVRVSTDNAIKLFPITPRVAAATYGWAFIDGRNINSHVNDFRVTLRDPNLPVEEIANQFGGFFQKVYQGHIDKKYDDPVAEGNYATAFLLGGYDPASEVGKVFEVYVPAGENVLRRSTNEQPGASWRGHTPVITRLLRGFDPRIADLKGYGEELAKLVDEENSLGYSVDYWAMTLQDAVDFALFMTHTTIQMQRFADGVVMQPGSSADCGGPIDLAVIDPINGIQWIQRKQLRGEPGRTPDLNGET